ncbi:MAG: serine hydrolase [Bacteroidetes bacterium]|jgi:CubicO group peptidase (beta-lactamase class C family)|nr:serine hydrolase [Bacteroidota bacterium]
MKKNLSLLLFLFSFSFSKAQSLYFPPLTGTTWDTVSTASLGWCQTELDTLLDYLGTRNTKAFILLKGGKIVAEKYYGTFTQDSLWYWASAGKTLTGFTIGVAQQEGHLSISDTTSQYLGTGWTDCPPNKEEMITIRHQLTMTSGLDDGVPDHHCTLDTCLQYLADAGTRWAYHNGPYTILDGVVQGATGQSLNVYFTQKVKNPTGMTGLFVPSGYNNVFYSKARSMARFGLLMLNRGNWNGTQVMTDTAYFNQMVNTSQQLNKSYGYLWWLNGKPSFMVPGLQLVIPSSLSPNAPPDMIAALGKNGQFINVVPSMDLVYIRMGNAPGQGEVPFLFNDTIWQKLNGVMCSAVSIPKTVVPQNLVEIFPNPGNGTFTIYPLQKMEGLVMVKVYGPLGNMVTWFQLDGMREKQFSPDGFAAGMYTAVIEYGTVIQTRKFIYTKP